MKKLFLFLLPLPLHAFPIQDDVQVWTKPALRYVINECSSILLESELRFGKDVSKLYFYYLQAGYIYHPYEWVEFSPAYRYIRVIPVEKSPWITIHAPHLDIQFKGNPCGWKLWGRNRVQYLMIESSPNLWQYRFRLLIQPPWKLKKNALRPFVSEEIFFLEREGFSESRFEIGATSWIKGLCSQVGTFYMLRHQHISGEWIRTHNFRFNVEFVF